MTIVQNLTRDFESIDEYLKAVSDILRDGHMPDLSGLDGRVSELCTTLQNADTDTQQQFVAKLSTLLKKLDVCEAEIKAFHETQMKDTLGHD